MKSKEDIQKEIVEVIAANPSQKYRISFEIYCKENNIDENDPIVCEAFGEIADYEWMVEAVREAGLFKNEYKED